MRKLQKRLLSILSPYDYGLFILFSNPFNLMDAELFVPAYLKDTYLFELKTKVAAIKEGQLLFEDTIFHPQGGGQPKDKGWVVINGAKHEIVNASADKETGQIWNKIQNVEGINVGDETEILIDEQTRALHAKLHSAGHLLDLAVQNLQINWEGAKGYHFQDGPYVEYKGAFEGLEEKQVKLNEQLKKILASEIETVKEHYSYEQAVEKGLIPKEFKTPLIRIVKFGPNSCPCGGTHIDSVKRIQLIEITNLKKKGKFIRAYYRVE